MAELGDRPAASLTLEKVGAVLQLLLQAADAILRLFGRRKTDRPVREPDES